MTDGLPSDVANHQLTLVTLGTTALRADENVTLFDLGKPLALITYLCCAPDRTVAREHLIDLLWGDVGPDAAKHALRQTLWYIRKRLGDRPLIAGGDALRIIAPIDFDRDRFLAAVADNNVETVVRLYTGDFSRASPHPAVSSSSVGLTSSASGCASSSGALPRRSSGGG